MGGPSGPGGSRENARADAIAVVASLRKLEARLPRGLGGPSGLGVSQENAWGDAGASVA